MLALPLTGSTPELYHGKYIAGMFASGEQGAWYDPSDLSTLFQDAYGTTPVTAVGQPVGLILDKSKGLVLGPELVAQPINFNANWKATLGGTPVASGSSFTTSIVGGFWINVLTPGKVYQATVTGTTTAASGVTLRQTNTTTTSQIRTGFGSAVFTAQSGFTYFYVRNESAGTTTVTSISVREVPGNHATQATTASRPIIPARYNLLTKTEQFDDAGWTKYQTIVLPNSIVAPDAKNTGDLVIPSTSNDTHPIDQAYQISNLTPLVLTIFAKNSATGTGCFTFGLTGSQTSYSTCLVNLNNGTISITGSAISNGSITPLSNGWFKCQHTLVPVSTGSSSYRVSIRSSEGISSFAGDGTSGIYIWGASLVPANQAHLPYQRVNTSTDYDTQGFPLYLRFDGVDDWLVTPSINFTATDKMTVFAGVRKLSDAAPGILIELGSIAAYLQAGSFAVSAPESTTSRYAFYSRGSTQLLQNAATSNNAYLSPVTNTLVVRSDIAADLMILNLNGTQVASSAADQGTGNYGNRPIYIGRRGGTQYPFNGHLYGLIVRGAATDDSHLTHAEKYLAYKSGVSL